MKMKVNLFSLVSTDILVLLLLWLKLVVKGFISAKLYAICCLCQIEFLHDARHVVRCYASSNTWTSPWAPVPWIQGIGNLRKFRNIFPCDGGVRTLATVLLVWHKRGWNPFCFSTLWRQDKRREENPTPLRTLLLGPLQCAWLKYRLTKKRDWRDVCKAVVWCVDAEWDEVAR